MRLPSVRTSDDPGSPVRSESAQFPSHTRIENWRNCVHGYGSYDLLRPASRPRRLLALDLLNHGADHMIPTLHCSRRVFVICGTPLRSGGASRVLARCRRMSRCHRRIRHQLAFIGFRDDEENDRAGIGARDLCRRRSTALCL